MSIALFVLVLLGVICAWDSRKAPPLAGDTLDSADVIVVLGYPTQEDGQPTEILRARVERGTDLYFKGYAQKLLFTGGATGDGFVEAEAMSDLAVELGVPPEDIVQETRAQNTLENAQYSADMMHEYGWSTVILVTSPPHIRRSIMIFEDQGINVAGYAASAEKYSRLARIGAGIYEGVNRLLYRLSRATPGGRSG